MDAQSVVEEYKIVIVGDGGVGKTTYINNYIECQKEAKKYMSKYETRAIILYTSHGPIKLTVWDTCGQEKFGGLRDGHYVGSHGAIIMFDLTARITYKNVPRWYKDITRICDNIPIVLAANKLDIPERKIKPRHINFHMKKQLGYCQISAKSNYQWQLPLLLLLRKLTDDNELQLVEKVRLREPVTEMDPQLIEKAKDEWANVNATLTEIKQPLGQQEQL